jgi:hypothetical protein
LSPEVKAHAVAVLLGPAVAQYGLVHARRLLKDAVAFIDELERAVETGTFSAPADVPTSRAIPQPHSISGGVPQSPTMAAFVAAPPPAPPRAIDDGGAPATLTPVATIEHSPPGMLPMQAADIAAGGNFPSEG